MTTPLRISLDLTIPDDVTAEQYKEALTAALASFRGRGIEPTRLRVSMGPSPDKGLPYVSADVTL